MAEAKKSSGAKRTSGAKKSTTPRRVRPALLTTYLAPYGYPAALEGLGSTAAPLLAGFSFALIGLTIDKDEIIWKPDLSLLLLVIAGLLLVATVELTFLARQYYVSPGEFLSARELAKLDGISETKLRQWHSGWLQSYAASRMAGVWTYNAGTVVFLAAIASVLIPETGPWHMAPLRAIGVLLIVVSMVVLGFERVLHEPVAQWRWRQQQKPKRKKKKEER